MTLERKKGLDIVSKSLLHVMWQYLVERLGGIHLLYYLTPPSHSRQESGKVAPQVHPTQHCNS